MNNKQEVLSELIRQRRSIFPQSYTDQEIPKAVIEEILASANYAPTHKLTEPWRFKVFRGKALERLADFLADQYQKTTPAEEFMPAKHRNTKEKVLQSSCVIVISMNLSGKVPEWEELASVACAVQNMWLTATSLNVGAYWSTPGNLDTYKEFLKLDSNEKCIGLFYMGYHEAPDREANRSPIEEKVTWEE